MAAHRRHHTPVPGWALVSAQPALSATHDDIALHRCSCSTELAAIFMVRRVQRWPSSTSDHLQTDDLVRTRIFGWLYMYIHWCYGCGTEPF
jgi:hypothetical protein